MFQEVKEAARGKLSCFSLSLHLLNWELWKKKVRWISMCFNLNSSGAHLCETVRILLRRPDRLFQTILYYNTALGQAGQGKGEKDARNIITLLAESPDTLIECEKFFCFLSFFPPCQGTLRRRRLICKLDLYLSIGVPTDLFCLSIRK